MKKTFVLLLLLLLFSRHISAQSRIRSALDTLQQFYPREKIYVLCNKSEYIAGETIWFSVFVVSNYELSSLSTNLFVELYDREKKLLAIKQLPLLNGQASGQIQLSEKLNENIYFIRAYTQWMLNFSDDEQCIHAVKISNSKSAKKLQIQELPWKVEVFCEGGTLVDGIPTRVSVRLLSPSSLPQNWSGYVTEMGSGQKLSEFNSMDQNVGVAVFLPVAGHQYHITVEDKKGQQQTVNLPPVTATGVHLETYNFNDSIQYIIRFRNIPGSGKGYKLVGTINDQLVYEAMIRRSDSILTRFIPVTGLYNGILRLTVFDENDHAVAERLCFVKPLELETKKLVFTEKRLNTSPRGLNALQFQSDTIENPFSVIVFDGLAKDPMMDESFLSSLWLTGDISRPVEKPAQYFNHPDLHTAAALDAILMSETWKGFNWKDILDDKYPILKYLPDSYISLKGTVLRNKKLVTNENVNLVFYFPDSSKQFMQAKTDNSGSFALSHLFFYDSAKVFYQLNQKKEAAKDINIQFERKNRPTPYQQSFPPINYTMVDRQAADQQSEMAARAKNALSNQQFIDDRYKLLEEVKVRAKVTNATQKLEQQLVSGAFKSFNETVFDFVNEDQHAQGYVNILQWLQGRVAGLQVETNGGDLVPVIRGSQAGIYIDEMQADPSMLNALSINDIALLKVVKGFFAGGIGGGGGGAVLIYTKRGGLRTASHAPSLHHTVIKGYDKFQNFPTPDYSEAIYRQIKNDTRDVLFWNAFAVSENDELKVPIRFYNNDTCKEFRIVIIGIAATGEPVYYNEVLK